jgi:integrase
MESWGDPLWRTLIQDKATELLQPDRAPFLSEVLERYLREAPRGEKRSSEDIKRAVSRLIKQFGDRPITAYRRLDATAFRDSLLRKVATTTTRRQLADLTTVFNFGLREYELPGTNPFAKLPIKGEGSDAKKREPFTVEELLTIKLAAEARPDDLGNLVGLMFETGARLEEILGLKVSDVVLSGPCPYLSIQPHPLRSLKTPQSKRDVPLMGVSLMVASRLKPTRGGFFFPRFTGEVGERLKPGSASKTASKEVARWMAKLGFPKSSHSFRHSIRDRLRVVQCPEPIAEQIGGWGKRSVSQGYGTGYPLTVLKEWMEKVEL